MGVKCCVYLTKMSVSCVSSGTNRYGIRSKAVFKRRNRFNISILARHTSNFFFLIELM